MLLAGMNSVTAVNRTLQGMHEGKQLDYATPAASCWLELHVSLEGLSSIVKLASTLLSSTWLLSCLEPIRNGLTTLCSLRGSGLWPPTFLRNRTANGSWSYIKVDPFLQQVVSDCPETVLQHFSSSSWTQPCSHSPVQNTIKSQCLAG